jgi:phosphatidylglycerophosphate synthase
MIVANIFDFIDGKVAHITNKQSAFGAFWDSTLDRFSDISLFLGLIYLYSRLHRTDYVMVSSLAMMFTIMTSYARARAESLIQKCKVGFMERPERIVLFMIGAFTNRMARVMWVILDLSIVTVANRIHYTYLVLNGSRFRRAQSADRRVLACVLLARRADHGSLRSVGGRDPGVRVADAARLAARSNRQRQRTVGMAGILIERA